VVFGAQTCCGLWFHLVSWRFHAESVALVAKALRCSVDRVTGRTWDLAEMRGVRIGLIECRLRRDLRVAAVAAGARRHLGRLRRRRIAVARCASEAGGDVLVNQIAMTAAVGACATATKRNGKGTKNNATNSRCHLHDSAALLFTGGTILTEARRQAWPPQRRLRDRHAGGAHASFASALGHQPDRSAR
jgi:hypothetical protein